MESVNVEESLVRMIHPTDGIDTERSAEDVDPGLPGSTSNPLQNEDILEQIVDYLPFNSLKKCRLVNSLWNLVGSRVIGKKCNPIILTEVFQSESAPQRQSFVRKNLSKLLSVVNTSWNFPCKAFCLDCEINTGNPQEEEVLTTFFKTVGPWATYLQLVDHNGDKLFHKLHPRNIQYNSLKQFVLHMVDDKTDAESFYSNLEFMSTVLQNAPNLKCLHLDSIQDPEVVSSFLNVMQLCNYGKLKYLALKGDVRDEHLIKVQGMEMQLQGFNLEVASNARVTGERLQSFLETQREHLVDLYLGSLRYKGQLITLELPCFPKLKTLKLEGVYRRSSAARLETPAYQLLGVSYQNQLPVLKRLQFSLDAVRNHVDFLDADIEPSETVQELELSSKLKDPMVVVNAARIFPNLKKLKVPARTLVVRAAYEMVQNVEELTLETREDLPSLDTILTGYSKKECAAIQNLSTRLQRGVEIITEPNAFLHNLKTLRFLPSNTPAEEEDYLQISDISCNLVLLKMRNLRRLDFTWGNPQISEEIVQEMRRKFTVCGKKVEDYNDENEDDENDEIEVVEL